MVICDTIHCINNNKNGKCKYPFTITISHKYLDFDEFPICLDYEHEKDKD